MPQKGDLENLTRVAHDVLKASPATQIIEKSVAGVEGAGDYLGRAYRWGRRKVKKLASNLPSVLPAEKQIPPRPSVSLKKRTTDIRLSAKARKGLKAMEGTGIGDWNKLSRRP